MGIATSKNAQAAQPGRQKPLHGRHPLLGLLLACAWGLGGCDQLGIETPAKTAERVTADAKAIGSACRHAMRAIEDCYVLNPKAEKSAVYAGWREMDEYMRENKLEGVAPVVPRPAASAASKPKPKPEDEDTEEDPSTGDGDKPVKHSASAPKDAPSSKAAAGDASH
jgi:hypothetical protein